MHIRTCGLCLWEFLTGELPCPSCPSAPTRPAVKPVCPEKPIAADDKLKKSLEAYDATVEKVRADYDDSMTLGPQLSPSTCQSCHTI